jgi:hypothetical protein
VDVVAELQAEQVAAFVQQLHAAYYVDLERVRAAVSMRQSFNLVHLATMVKVDIFIPEDRPFDRQEMTRAVSRAIDTAPDARSFAVKAPEDLVLRKLLWYQAGREVSEQQWNDVVGVLRVQKDRLDEAYLSHWAAELAVADLLLRAQTEASNS